MASNPLDGLFKKDHQDGKNEGQSSSSDSETTLETVADMILRAVSTLANSGFENKWIADGNRYFFFDSNSKRLLCHTRDGRYMHYLGNGRYVPIEDPTGGRSSINEEITSVEVTPEQLNPDIKESVCWITTIPSDHLEVMDSGTIVTEKKHRTEEGPVGVPKLTFSEIVEKTSIHGFKEFLEKWDLLSEESSVRHLIKLDKQLIQYLMRRFNPIKAKPKNALLKFSESLLKHPQKWRIVAAVQDGLIDSGSGCETAVVCEEIFTISGQSDERSCLELEEESAECRLVIERIASEFFLLNQDSQHPVFLDGMRVVPADGHVGPLLDGSVVTVPNAHAPRSNIPATLLLIEIGAAEDLLARRQPIDSQDLDAVN